VNHRSKMIGIVATVMLLACLTAVPVLAQPPKPCAFMGDVILDGQPTPGSTVTVELEGTQLPTNPPEVIVDSDSKYHVAVPQDPDTGEPGEGAELHFFVDGLYAGSSTWEARGYKTLDLAVETDVAPPDDDPDTPPVDNGPDPADTLALVWPWIALGAVVAGTIVFVWRRRARS